MSSETTHVIFDLDGILINSVDVVIDVLIDYAKSHGKDLTLDIKKKVANMFNFDIFFNEYFDSLSVTEDFNRVEVQNQIMEKVLAQKFQLIAGVEKLVRHLHKHNIPMGIASANRKTNFNKATRDHKDFFQAHFNPVICGYDDPDVVNKKPNPDIYFVCADRFPQKPKDYKNVVIIEDSLTGITGAVASGMKTLLINDRKLCNFEAIADKITLMCDSFDDFRPETLGLPAYES